MPAKKVTKRKRKDGEETRNSILIEAEKLFAEHGFDGVSVRDITTAAEVDLALVNYHFKSKENLFHQVLSMRVDDMNERRRELMANVDLSGDPQVALEALLDAFLLPFNGESKAASGRLANYRRLLALVANSRRWQQAIFNEHYDPIVRDLIDHIVTISPSVDRKHLFWTVSFFLGTIASAYADTRRVDRLSDSLCDSSDLDDVRRRIVTHFATAFLSA